MNRLTLALAAAVLVPAAAVPLFAQQVVLVRFPAGTSGTTINDSITGRQYRDYRIGVRAGQLLKVNMRTLRGSPYFNVLEPGSADFAIYNGSTSGPDFEVRTRMAGNYTVRVYQMRNDERRGATAGYRLSIAASGSGVVGHPTAPAHQSGDALVRGTPYHATTTVRCRVDASMRWGQCKAGVIRRPGSATVHLDTLDGGERTILFRDGRAVSSDAGGMPFNVERRGDTSVVRIGRFEIYEIPDALPMGG